MLDILCWQLTIEFPRSSITSDDLRSRSRDYNARARDLVTGIRH